MRPAVSITAPQFASSVDGVADAAAFAEQAGLSGIFVFDHLVPLGDPRRPVLEMAALLGSMAAATTRIHIGTLVLRAPLRGAAVSAAIGRTAAAIAPGRAILGIGAGDAQSADEARRFGQAAESLERRVAEVASVLELTATAGIRRWVGGTHPRMLELAGGADGWNGWGLDPERFSTLGARVRAAGVSTVSWGGGVVLGSDDDEVQSLLEDRGSDGGVIAGTPARVADRLARLVSAGADHLVVSVLPNRRERWELFAERVVPRLN